MCLDTVGKTVTLKKDMIVQKHVRIVDENEMSMPLQRRKQYNFTKKRLHKSNRKRVIKCEQSVDKYIPHFHSFTSKRVANKIQRQYPMLTVCEFIIPQGTTVVYGKQSIDDGNWVGAILIKNAKVIVTPVLINPRVPE